MSVDKNRLSNKKIVLFGGGTGNAVFLRGLKNYTEQITAIVNVSDDGGSSGKLREDYGILPPGDIRNCIIALAKDENIMARLMDVRFKNGFMDNQSFGNIFITAMYDIMNNFPTAVKEVSKVLAIKGAVLPVCSESVTLSAELSNGMIVQGESTIPKICAQQNLSIKRMKLIPEDATVLAECIEAIRQADILLYSPGSLYTSLLPVLLTKGLSGVIRNSKAKKYFIANIMTQHGETDRFRLSDHLKALHDHIDMTGLIDTVVYNTRPIPIEIRELYQKESSYVVDIDLEHPILEQYELIGLPCAHFSEDLSERSVIGHRSVVRHNSEIFWNYLQENIQ